MAWKNMAAGMERFLVQRRRANGVDLALLGQLNCANDKLVGRVAGDGREHAPRQIFRDQLQVNTIRDPGCELRLGESLDGAHRDFGVHDACRFAQPACIADHQRTAPAVQIGVAQALHDNLRPDAGGVAHGDTDGGQRNFVHEITLRLLENMQDFLRDGFAELFLRFRREMNAVDPVRPNHLPSI